MATDTYDPKRYVLVVAGIPIPAEGYAEDEFIKLERDSQLFTDKVGADGKVTRAKSHDKRATCTFSTMQGAAVNAVLSTLAKLDESSDNGAGIGPFALENLDGTTVHEADECWIAKLPDGSLGKEPTARAWMIRIAQLNSIEGT